MFSVIVVTYNSEQHIEKCIESIIYYSPDDTEIIIVDNSGKDYGLKDVVVNKSGSYPSGLNQGIVRCSGSHIVCCNSDIIATPGWLSAMRQTIGQGYGIATPISNFASGIQGMNNWPVQVCTMDVRFFIGFCFMLTPYNYHLIGNFDEQFEFENDDIDYSMRATKSGIRMGVVPHFISHVGSQSIITDKNLNKRWKSFYRLFAKYPTSMFSNIGIQWHAKWFYEVEKRYPEVKELDSFQHAKANSAR
jgi:GT2 family glycosyltransferase